MAKGGGLRPPRGPSALGSGTDPTSTLLSAGGLAIFVLSSSRSPHPLREGCPPPRLPDVFFSPPGGGSRGGRKFLFRPRRLREGIRCSKIATNMAQNSSTWFKLPSNMPPRGPRNGSKCSRNPPRTLSRAQILQAPKNKISCVCLLAFFAADGILKPQD